MAKKGKVFPEAGINNPGIEKEYYTGKGKEQHKPR